MYHAYEYQPEQDTYDIPIERMEHGLKFKRMREFDREEKLHKDWVLRAEQLIHWYCL